MTRRTDQRFLDTDVRVGHVSGLHGIRGEVKLFVYNPSSNLLADRSSVMLVGPDGERRQVKLSLRQGAGLRVLGQIEGIGSRDAAAALMGWELVVAADELPPPELGSWYHRDLIGLPVRSLDGRDFGRIAEIHDTGEVDIWLIKGPRGVRLLPVLQANLVSVTPASDDQPGQVVVTDDAIDDQPPL